MEQRGREKDSWEELGEKAIDAEAKASLQPSSYVRDMDQRCPRGNRPAHTTASNSQVSATRDPRDEPSEEAPAQDLKRSHSSRSENGETSEKEFREEKKKKQRRRDHERTRKDFETPANGVQAPNGVNASNASRARKDMSQIVSSTSTET